MRSASAGPGLGMNTSTLLTWLVTFGLLAWVLAFIFRRSRRFAAHPLAGPRMRQITGLYLPLLEIVLLLCLLGVAYFSRAGSGGLRNLPAQVFFGLAALCALVLGVLVAVQGFTLSERSRSRGELDAARSLRTSGFFVLVVGAAGVLVTMFAALILANPFIGS